MYIPSDSVSSPLFLAKDKLSKYAQPTDTSVKSEHQANTKDTVSISWQARELAAQEQTSEKTSDSIYALKYGQLDTYDNMSVLEKAQQALIDKRIGLDREKIEEINDKMEAIINDETISDEEKESLLAALAEEKEAEYEKAAKRTEEQAKLESTAQQLKP